MLVSVVVCGCRNWHDFTMATSRQRKRLLDAYRFPGLRPLEEVRGVFGDPKARVITLVRRSKKRSARNVVERTWAGTTARPGGCATYPAATRESIWRSRFGGFNAEAAAR